MPRATLVTDRETERDYQIVGGRMITIVYDDCNNSFSFHEDGNELDGEFEFKDEDDSGERFLLKRMYSAIPKSGLGREVLKFFLDINGGVIYTRLPDGITQDDGSHLTDMAITFVRRMQDEDLIEKWGNENEEEY